MSMNSEMEKRYFDETARALRREGFQVEQLQNGQLTVILNNLPVCEVCKIGGIEYSGITTPELLAAEDTVYVALCGTSEHAMLWMLEQNPNLQSVCLCLDHDEAGIEASGRLAEILHERGYHQVGLLQPEHKDWNEDLKARHGLPAQDAEEHPQLIVAPEICGRIGKHSEDVRVTHWEQDIPLLMDCCQVQLRLGKFDIALDCMEQASAIALAAYGRELRQLGEPITAEALAESLRRSILPHQNRGSLKNRHSELAAQFQSVLAKAKAPGIRGEAKNGSWPVIGWSWRWPLPRW